MRAGIRRSAEPPRRLRLGPTPSFVRGGGARHDLHELGRVVAEDVDNLDRDLAAPRLRVLVRRVRQLQHPALPCRVGPRNFFALCEIFEWLASKRIDLARWTFLLHEYRAVGAHTPCRAETVFAPVGPIDARTILALEGGVQILIRLPKIPIIDRAGEIVQELAQLLGYRPSRGSSFWSY